MLSIFPDIRFSYADLTIQGVQINFIHIQILVDESVWISNTSLKIQTNKVSHFKELVTNWKFHNKIKAVRGINRPFFTLSHHFKRNKVCGSVIYLMFKALLDYCKC